MEIGRNSRTGKSEGKENVSGIWKDTNRKEMVGMGRGKRDLRDREGREWWVQGEEGGVREREEIQGDERGEGESRERQSGEERGGERKGAEGKGWKIAFCNMAGVRNKDREFWEGIKK